MNKTVQTALAAALIAAHFILGLAAIRAQSPTYDEMVHFAAGWSYLKVNDYRLNTQDHPPFAKMWAAVPLFFMKAGLPIQHPYWQDVRREQYPFSNLFLYHNRVDPEKMLNSGRIMILALSALLGLAIFAAAKDMFGPPAGLLALALWCFLPAALANGTLVTTDTALALFYFTTIYYFRLVNREVEGGRKPGWVRITLLGLSLGLLFASKYSAAGVLPVMGLILVYLFVKKPRDAVKTAGYLAVSCVMAFAVLLVVYRFNDLGTFYMDGINKVFSGINSGRSSFLLGRYSTSGWIYYFPVTFLLKTPIPLLAMAALTLFFRKSWSRDCLLFLLLPAAAFFAMSCVSKMQIGHRHILEVYPFLIVWVSGAASYVSKSYHRYVFAALVALSAFSAVRQSPWFISYFNEFISSPDKGYRYLTDSNLDWGQGLKELGKYLKEENIDGIYLCYFGTADPSYYGIKYNPIGFIDNLSPPYTENERAGDRLELNGRKRVIFAISATNLKATYYADKQIFSFLDNVTPLKIVAHSIFVYDLAANPRAYAKFIELYNGTVRKK